MLVNPNPPAPQGQPQPSPFDWLGQPEPMSSPADRWDIASPPRRGIALLIDLLLLGLAVVVASYVIGERTTEIVIRDGQLYSRRVATLDAWNVRVVLLMWFSYLMMTERLFGATLGKRLTGIRVVQDDWSPLTLKAAVLRQLTHLVPTVVAVQPGLALTHGQAVTYGLGCVIALVSEDHRRLGDRLAGTLVIRHTSVPVPSAISAADGALLAATVPDVHEHLAEAPVGWSGPVSG